MYNDTARSPLRICTLADQYELESELVRRIAAELGIKVVSHFSPISLNEAALLRPRLNAERNRKRESQEREAQKKAAQKQEAYKKPEDKDTQFRASNSSPIRGQSKVKRIYIQASINDLEYHARYSYWNNANSLSVIADELRYRQSSRAEELLAEIRTRLIELNQSVDSRAFRDLTAKIAKLMEAERVANEVSERTKANYEAVVRSKNAEISRLSELLRTVTTERDRLKSELASTKQSSTSSESYGMGQLTVWGVATLCPDFVLKAVHRAWRHHLHPDSHPGRTEAEKRELSQRFQSLESDFKTAFKQRGIS